MSISDFKDEALIEKIYIRELETYFREKLGATQVRALDFQVPKLLRYSDVGLCISANSLTQMRVRDPNFPYYSEKPALQPQPSLMTHVGIQILRLLIDASLRLLGSHCPRCNT